MDDRMNVRRCGRVEARAWSETRGDAVRLTHGIRGGDEVKFRAPLPAAGIEEDVAEEAHRYFHAAAPLALACGTEALAPNPVPPLGSSAWAAELATLLSRVPPTVRSDHLADLERRNAALTGSAVRDAAPAGPPGRSRQRPGIGIR